jgi:magnesium transporter
MLLELCAESTRRAASLKASVYALDERMDERPEDVALGAIVQCRRALRRIDAVTGEQAAVFALLGVIDTPFLGVKGSVELFETVSRNAAYATRAVDRVEKHLSDLHQQYDAHQQDKTNRRLAVLTVISAIFLPLTLITGIYGMNFDVMPGLHFRHAYPVALLAMAAIAGGLYWCFRSRGWLDCDARRNHPGGDLRRCARPRRPRPGWTPTWPPLRSPAATGWRRPTPPSSSSAAWTSSFSGNEPVLAHPASVPG